jgi:predicted RNA-binding protein YlxR (DUF448 family)
MAIRKIPQRKCVGCGTSKDKKELIRVVKNAEGEISVDLTGKKNGRGAYICHSSKCLAAAIKAKRFERAFGCAVEQHIYDNLLNQLEQE